MAEGGCEVVEELSSQDDGIVDVEGMVKPKPGIKGLCTVDHLNDTLNDSLVERFSSLTLQSRDNSADLLDGKEGLQQLDLAPEIETERQGDEAAGGVPGSAQLKAGDVEMDDSGSPEPGVSGEEDFTEMIGVKKKKKTRGSRNRRRSKKSEEDLCVVEILEEETSFTILPRSDVKEMVKEMTGEVNSQDGKSPAGKSAKPPRREKMKKSVVNDVLSHPANSDEDNTKYVNSGVGKTEEKHLEESEAVGSPNPKSQSKRRRERKKKLKECRNVALASLLSRDPKQFNDDSDELPEMVKQFLEENGKKVDTGNGGKSTRGRNQSTPQTSDHSSPRPAGEKKRNKDRKKSADKTPVQEGCYSKLLKQHNVRERHDSLPAKFDKRRGSSPASFSAGAKNRTRYYSQSNEGPFDLFEDAKPSPKQNLFQAGNRNEAGYPKRDKKKKNRNNRDGTPDSPRWERGKDQRRQNFAGSAEDKAMGNQSPRYGSPARPRSHAAASASPGPQAEMRQNSTPGASTPKSQTPKGASGRGTPNNRGNTPGKRSRTPKKNNIQFEPYMSNDEMGTLLKRGVLIKGSIRINPRNYEEAYVPHPDKKADVIIRGLADRNRALNGDIVVVKLKTGNKDDESPMVNADQQKQLPDAVREVLNSIAEKAAMRSGKVVGIIEANHCRACTGHIKPMKDQNKNFVLFSPIDHRMPRIKVPASDCPKGFAERPDDFANTLFVARITGWDQTSQFATGNVHRSLGEAGQIEPETEGMLNDYGVDYSEFTPAVLECLPKNLPWRIPESELEKRKDLRKEIVFTIDPASARDLDDALSCVDLGDGTYEIGVHIADVSYFVHEHTELDSVAASRATSVYLVQKVVPMLPRLLCEKLCSLNPDEDRLTFSVIWKMSETGEILDIWFGRSVIRSCVKLSYAHAQGFLDEPDREWTRDELPPISEGVSIDDIKSRVLSLNKIAKNLRGMRAENGALRLDQVKLMFVLDKETGQPCGWSVYSGKDSNKLIEEFMLLANMSVANKIRRAFPEKAMLRCHPPPQTKMIEDLMHVCDTLDIPLDASSSRALQESLTALYGEDEDTQSRLQILTVLCSKPMQLAKYFCTGTMNGEEDCWHYALSVPEYTHFTSPIRRYPDVIVHRQLAAALELTPEPKASKDSIQKLADHCNLKKSNAKRVSEMSSDMFFAIFVKECGPIEESGMVMSVLDRSFDVLILKFGVTKRVYTNKLNLLESKYEKKDKVPRLTLKWNLMQNGEQKITLFTKVQCIIEADPQPLKWNVLIKPPVCEEDEADDMMIKEEDAPAVISDESQQLPVVAANDIINAKGVEDLTEDDSSEEASDSDVIVEEVIETVLEGKKRNA